jgi:hypothetical protein
VQISEKRSRKLFEEYDHPSNFQRRLQCQKAIPSPNGIVLIVKNLDIKCKAFPVSTDLPLSTRHARLLATYRGFFHMACALITLRVVLK